MPTPIPYSEDADGCEACGEPLDGEMGEFVDDSGEHRLCHAQCGLDRGWPTA